MKKLTINIILLLFSFSSCLFSKKPPIESYSSIVKKISPSIVNIYASKIQQNYFSPFLSDPMFRHFFGYAFLQNGPRSRAQRSLGSGVIVREDGVIITNSHIIKHAAKINVVLSDGREYPAKVLVDDKRTNLAIITLEARGEKFPFLTFQDADTLEIGDVVLALGNPFGFGHMLTMGVVSGLPKSQVGIADFRSLIQTDAHINPGNSGGPLVTVRGDIVGINADILSKNGYSSGIGFAIPSNLILPVLSALENDGKVIRPWVGISMESIEKKHLDAFNLTHQKGVYIKYVFQDSPASRSSLKKGDIILKIGDHVVRNESSFRFHLATMQVGSHTILTVLRESKIIKVPLTLQAPPDIPGNRKINLTGRNPLSGALITALSPSVANDLGVSYVNGGVVIIDIRDGTSAALTGLLPGDVVTSINGVQIKTLDDLLKNLSRSHNGWKINYLRHSVAHLLHVRHW